jgi:hypothetical protein
MVGVLALFIYWAIGDVVEVLIIVGSLAVAVSVLAARAFVVSRRRDGVDGLYWRGHVGFVEDDFEDKSLFPNIRRTASSSFGRQGLSGGRLEIRTDGLAWDAGSVLTPRCELSGSFRLPWEAVEGADVSDIPMKSRLLGGALTFFLSGGGEIQGEFLGSRRTLLDALRRSPLGDQRPNTEHSRHPPSASAG